MRNKLLASMPRRVDTKKQRRLLLSAWCVILYAVIAVLTPPQAGAVDLSPIGLSGQVAQQSGPQLVPTDVTPFTVAPERNSFNPGSKFRLFQMLPERLWFTATTEASQRPETNVLFTANHAKADYVLRALPNITLGYNVLKNTSVYTNYFALKDLFAAHPILSVPTTQSLAWGIRHNKSLSERTNLQFDFQARELWQTTSLHQFDFLPGVTLTHRLARGDIAFASALLQMRGAQYFVAPTRELDPFYSVGYMRRRGAWTLSVSDTLATNYRNPLLAVPHQSNISMISDIEVNRPVCKRLPSLLAFARAEPIWNAGAHNAPGLSGFDFRLFTGMRFTISKPSYYAAMDRMRSQILAQSKAAKPDPDPSISIKPGKEIDAGSAPLDRPTSVTDPGSQAGTTQRQNLSLNTDSTALSFAGFDSAAPIGNK